MARAKKCDVCGSLYEYYETAFMGYKIINGISLVNINSRQDYSTKKILDCCPECMNSIKQYIESLKDSKGVKDDR